MLFVLARVTAAGVTQSILDGLITGDGGHALGRIEAVQAIRNEVAPRKWVRHHARKSVVRTVCVATGLLNGDVVVLRRVGPAVEEDDVLSSVKHDVAGQKIALVDLVRDEGKSRCDISRLKAPTVGDEAAAVTASCVAVGAIAAALRCRAAAALTIRNFHLYPSVITVLDFLTSARRRRSRAVARGVGFVNAVVASRTTPCQNRNTMTGTTTIFVRGASAVADAVGFRDELARDRIFGGAGLAKSAFASIRSGTQI